MFYKGKVKFESGRFIHQSGRSENKISFIAVAMMIVLFILRSLRSYSYHDILVNDLLLIIVMIILMAIPSLLTRYWLQYLNLILIPINAVILVFVIHELLFPEKPILTSENFYQAIIGFLSFTGTFDLGYFVYFQGRIQRDHEKQKSLMILNSDIENINLCLIRIQRYLRNNHSSTVMLSKVEYRHDWQELFYNGASLVYDSKEVEDVLKWFYSGIMSVNIAIDSKNASSILKEIEIMTEEDEKYARPYNLLEVQMAILDAVSDTGPRIVRKSWLDEKNNQEMINDLCRRYYPLIENHIFSYLLLDEYNKQQIGKLAVGKHEEIDLSDETFSWFTKNSPEIKALVNCSRDNKRIVTRVIFDCSLEMERSSQIVGYVWGCHHLK